jgi:DNA-binding CsgD family transcriptional regulator
VDILQQLIQDQPSDQIASFLSMSVEQVEKYIQLMMRKFETESLVSLKHIAKRILSRRSP